MKKVYAVSGSASGIGKAVAVMLAAEGHKVIGIDIKKGDIIADLSTPKGRTECITRLCEQASGGLDGFIPCAGVGGHLGLSDQVIEVNYCGSVDLIEGALPLLKKRRGTVVIIGSNSMAIPGIDERLIQLMLHGDFQQAKVRSKQFAFDPYAAAKTALCIWMRKKAIETISEGVRINAIAPGMTETGMVAAQRESSVELAGVLNEFAVSAPIGYAAEPEVIAGVIGFLLSSASSFVVGEVLYADGGHAAQFRPEHV